MPADDAFPGDLPVDAEFGTSPEGRSWLATLPDLVRDLETRWALRTGSPFRGGTAAWAAPAWRTDGTEAVLKVSWPHREAREEGTGLAFWDGAGAVRLYEHDRASYALLVERCFPGVTMSAVQGGARSAGGRIDEAEVQRLLSAGASVLVELWSRPAPAIGDTTFEAVSDVTDEWAVLVRERMRRLAPPFDPGLVERGASLLETLPTQATRSVVVHGDFNPGNLLTASRRPWLAIDAKPMIGDPAYDPLPLLTQVDPPFDRPDAPAVLERRYRFFAELVGEDPTRLLAWSLARTVESALWDVSRRRLDNGQRDMRQAAVFADLLDV